MATETATVTVAVTVQGFMVSVAGVRDCRHKGHTGQRARTANKARQARQGHKGDNQGNKKQRARNHINQGGAHATPATQTTQRQHNGHTGNACNAHAQVLRTTTTCNARNTYAWSTRVGCQGLLGPRQHNVQISTCSFGGLANAVWKRPATT